MSTDPATVSIESANHPSHNELRDDPRGVGGALQRSPEERAALALERLASVEEQRERRVARMLRDEQDARAAKRAAIVIVIVLVVGVATARYFMNKAGNGDGFDVGGAA